MKKIMVFLFACMVLLFSACASSPGAVTSSETVVSSSSAISATSSSSESTPTTSVSESSSASTSVSSAVSEPQKDVALSEKLSSFMFENFGGSGDAAFATSWYPFIESLEVYSDGASYYGMLELTESGNEETVRAILSQHFTPANLDFCVPILMDAGAALKLDTVSICVMGESLAKILTGSSGLEVYYASLYSYNIPVYSYLATALEVSESEIIETCGFCGGSEFANFILMKMQEDFGGSFTGITSDTTKTISLAALTGFHDVYLKEMIVVDSGGKKVTTIKNTIPKT